MYNKRDGTAGNRFRKALSGPTPCLAAKPLVKKYLFV